MTAKFVQERITQLRLQKGVSEYKMSYDLGHSRGYIYNISSGKTLPSMNEFFAICDYFEITPEAFFNKNLSAPALVLDIQESLCRLKESDLILVKSLIERLSTV